MGIYRIGVPGHAPLLHIGQGRIADRLRQHRQKAGILGHSQSQGFGRPWLHSWAALPALDPENLLEIEKHLIAAHVMRHNHAPD